MESAPAAPTETPWNGERAADPPALDLKQATAAVFYALGRGWLAVTGLSPEEKQHEHIQSEGASSNFVLVRETERARSLISTSITEHVRRAGTAVRDSYPSGGVSWQKILDHLTKSGRGKFESTHKGKVTTGSWRQYRLKQCTEPLQLIEWVRRIVPNVQSDALELTVPSIANIAGDASDVTHAWSDETQATHLLQQARAALRDERRAHLHTSLRLEEALRRNHMLATRVTYLEDALASSQPDSDLPFPAMPEPSLRQEDFRVPAPVVVSAPALAPAARGVKRQGAVLNQTLTQPREGPYGTRRLWRVVTPSGESRHQTAAVEFVAGSHVGIGAEVPHNLGSDFETVALPDFHDDAGSLPRALDAAWAPTDLGPIQFS